jgi:hypothetical protein
MRLVYCCSKSDPATHELQLAATNELRTGEQGLLAVVLLQTPLLTCIVPLVEEVLMYL